MLNSVARSFSRGAQNYDLYAQIQHRVVDHLCSMIGENIINAESILDLGCGTGRLLQYCNEVNPNAKLTGLDISSEMLAQVKFRGMPINCVEAAIESTGLEAGKYDLIVSSSALQWTQPVLAAAEIARLSAYNGKVVISWFSFGTLSSWRELWGGVHRPLLESDQWLDAFKTVGFKVTQVDSQRYVDQMTDFEEAIRSVKGIGAGVGSVGSQSISKASYLKTKKHFDELVQKNGFFPMEYQTEFILLGNLSRVS